LFIFPDLLLGGWPGAEGIPRAWRPFGISSDDDRDKAVGWSRSGNYETILIGLFDQNMIAGTNKFHIFDRASMLLDALPVQSSQNSTSISMQTMYYNVVQIELSALSS
jgi:hypothetical protein